MKLTQLQVGAILIVIIVALGVILYGFPPKFTKQSPTPSQKQATTQASAPVSSFAGKVSKVDAKNSSFALVNAQDQKTVTITIGKDTTMVRLVFPADVKSLPANKAFSPERKNITLADMKVGDQVFVRLSKPVNAGQDATDPLEVQVLP